MQTCTFRVDYGSFMPTICDRNHDLRRAPVCFMVLAAPVMFLRVGRNDLLPEGSGPVEATARNPTGQRFGGKRSGEALSAAAMSPPAPRFQRAGIGCRGRAPGSPLHPGSVRVAKDGPTSDA